MITGYLQAYKSTAVVIETEELLGYTNYYAMVESTGEMVYINSRELKRKLT